MNLLEEYQKICPTCQQQYEARRLNQVYCSRKCKMRLNNRKAKHIRESYESITKSKNEILWNNRNILKRHEGHKVLFENLIKAGFVKKHVTHFGMDERGKNLLYCYDFGYKFVEESTIEIFKI